MDNKKELDKIKSDLEDNIGSKIKFASKRGRKKRTVRNGVIEGTYANVFVIKVDSLNEEETAERRVSYTYADILTKNVELALCK
ncbi:MAG: Veg protein [Ruminococcaceae bacterium]|nr:Veg protein [Oscillospiraceae bacterium]